MPVIKRLIASRFADGVQHLRWPVDMPGLVLLICYEGGE